MSEEVKRVKSRIKITNSRIDGKGLFGGANFLQPVDFSRSKFDGGVDFSRSTFSEYAGFNKSTFGVSADFSGSTFIKLADFNRSTFGGDVRFFGSIFSEYAGFTECKFRDYAWFNGSTFGVSADFSRSIFSKGVEFWRSTFSGYVAFQGSTFDKDAGFTECTFSKNADFSESTFSRNADFSGSTFRGDVLTFRDAKFTLPRSQEGACRRAKNALAKAGNRDEEEYHFYKEMEAKRICKGIRGNSGLRLGYLLLQTETWSFRKFFFHDVLEWFFVQKVFGYGVHPIWLFGWWLGFVAFFIIVYWAGKAVGIAADGQVSQSFDLYDYIWFSIATAATPGYALYKPLDGYKIIAGLEAIIGTFMWAAFITSFARKFSR